MKKLKLKTIITLSILLLVVIGGFVFLKTYNSGGGKPGAACASLGALHGTYGIDLNKYYNAKPGPVTLQRNNGETMTLNKLPSGDYECNDAHLVPVDKPSSR